MSSTSARLALIFGVLTMTGPALAATGECVDTNGPIETVHPCAIDTSGVAELPRYVSVTMPTAARPVPVASTSQPHAAIVEDVARRYRIDPRLLGAMLHAESGGKVGAVSAKGALGLMQVMPATARSMGVADPAALLADPALAIETGAAYLKTLQARLGNDVPLIVAAYNAGPGAVLKAGMRVPAYRETQAYVARVMTGYAAAARPTALR